MRTAVHPDPLQPFVFPGADDERDRGASDGIDLVPDLHAERALDEIERPPLPALVLDATGMRIGELEALTWGDVDEPRQRWRVSGAVAKTGRARWVPVPTELFQAVTRLVAREDRTPEQLVFQGFGGDRFRTAITRACTAAGASVRKPAGL